MKKHTHKDKTLEHIASCPKCYKAMALQLATKKFAAALEKDKKKFSIISGQLDFLKKARREFLNNVA